MADCGCGDAALETTYTASSGISVHSFDLVAPAGSPIIVADVRVGWMPALWPVADRLDAFSSAASGSRSTPTPLTAQCFRWPSCHSTTSARCERRRA